MSDPTAAPPLSAQPAEPKQDFGEFDRERTRAHEQSAAEPKQVARMRAAALGEPKDEQVERIASDLRDHTAPEYIDGKPSASAHDTLLMKAADLIEFQQKRIAALELAAARNVIFVRDVLADYPRSGE